MNLVKAGIASVAVGVLLLGASFAWPYVVPQKSLWSRKQAVAYQEASGSFHADTFDTKLSPEELAQSEAEYEELRKELDRAVAAHKSTPFYLRVLGLFVAGVGVCLVLAEQNNS